MPASFLFRLLPLFRMSFRRAFCSSARRCSQRSPEEVEAYKRKRRAEWKRKQGGQSFLDHVIVSVRGGKGGDGCAAFHREKFKPFGPPSGGNGGRGGSVHFLPTPTLTTLSTIQTRIRGHKGENGKGTWQNGKAGEPLIVKVPLGTVIRELGRNDPRRAKDEWESEEEAMAAEGLDAAEKMERMRETRWVHYPGFGETNAQREDFKEEEAAMYKLERERRIARRRRLDENPIYLDLDKVEHTASVQDDNAPLGVRQQEYLGHLIAKGGQGGLGNPHFVTSSNRSPRYATRGHEGERVTLSLELKLLADIGLVGMPNAGKSTLLRALTGGRAKTDVAGYAFTTLNPVVGIVRVASDRTFEGELVPEETVYGETKIEEEAYEEKLKKGDFAHSLTRNQLPSSPGEGDHSSSGASIPATEADASANPIRPGYHFDLYESFRFTIADNPGLIENSASPSAHAGLGHSFLRAIERSLALVCVVDFAAGSRQTSVINDDVSDQTQGTDTAAVIEEVKPDSAQEETLPTVDVNPFEAIKILKNELETYQEGMSSRIRLVIANKADLVASPSLGSTSASVQQAKTRLRELEAYAKRELGEDVTVVPVSGKYRMNLRKVVALMKGFVEDARAENKQDVADNMKHN